MSSPYPRLTNGTGTTQGIYDVVTTPVTKVGMRATLDDGRVYYYARQSSSNAIVAGNVLAGEVASVDMDDMVTGTHAVGSTVINITPVGTKTYAANELAEGYVCVNSGATGVGTSYKIKSHIAVAATTATDLSLYDPVAIAIDATAKTHVVKNTWMDPIIAPTSAQGVPAGVSNVAVVAGDSTARYFWCQTWGMCAVTAGSASAIGDALMNDTTTAGETLIQTAGIPQIAIAATLGVDGDFVFAMLNIAP